MTVDEPLNAPEHSRDQLWAALDNPSSFHLTEPSLLNALADTGYSSVLHSRLPSGDERTPNRALSSVSQLDAKKLSRCRPSIEKSGTEQQKRRRPLKKSFDAMPSTDG